MLEFVAGDTWPEPMEDGAPTPPPDPTAVSGILRRLNGLQADRDLMDTVVEAEIRRLNEWRADRQSGIDKQIAYGKQAVEIFMRRFYEASGKKSLALAEGTPHLTAARDRLIVDDDEAFMEWAIGPDVNNPAHPELLRITYEVDPAKDEIKKQAEKGSRTIDRTGVDGPKFAYELLVDGGKIPGVHIEKGIEDIFDVTLEEHV